MNRNDVERTFRFLGHREESELRLIAPGGRGEPRSIFVHSEQEFIRAAEQAEAATTHNVYVGLNERRRGGTKEADVVALRVFALDLDPVREKDSSSTDIQVSKAHNVAAQIREWCASQGFRAPSMAMSGNGYQLWFKIPPVVFDEKEDRHAWTARLKIFADHVRHTFQYTLDKHGVRLDSTHDLPRVMKLIGTVSIKGTIHRSSKWEEYDVTPDKTLKEYLEHLETPTATPLSEVDTTELSDDETQKIINNEDIKDLFNGTVTIGKNGTFPSRSEAEAALITRLLAKGMKTYTQINRVMMQAKIGKWTTSTEQYRKKTFEKMTTFVQNHNINFTLNETLLDKRVMAEHFWSKQPFFYDHTHLWWFWNWQDHSYSIADETDILNAIDLNRLARDSINAKQRGEIIEALKRVGRGHVPEPAQKTWVQFQKTIFDVKTGETFEASPDYFVTNPIPWKIGSSDSTPVLDQLFKDWMGAKGQDYVPTLFEIAAYVCLCDYPIHRYFILFGPGGNGKGKYRDILKRLIGDKNFAASDLHRLLSRPFEVAKLYHKTACFMGETNFSEIKNTGVLKGLTGEDPLSFEFKGKNPFDAVNYAKIIIATNSLPPTADKTRGFYRRPLIIDFPNIYDEKTDIMSLVPDHEFENLSRKIAYKILPFLLKQRAFTREGTVEEREQRYEDVSDPLQRFIREHIESDPDGFVFRYEFRERFIAWMKQNGYRTWSEYEIGTTMNTKYDSKQRLNPLNNNQNWAYLGISWRKTPQLTGLTGFTDLSLSISHRETNIETPVKPVNPVISDQRDAIITFLKQNGSCMIVTILSQFDPKAYYELRNSGEIVENRAGWIQLKEPTSSEKQSWLGRIIHR